MLGRTAGSVWSAARLARGPRVSDPAVLAMVGRIRQALGSPPLQAGQDGIRLTVGPKLTIRGTIKPGLDREGKPSMPAVIGVRQFVPVKLEGEPEERNCSVGRQVPVDAQGHFTITDLLPCEAELEAQGRIIKVNLDRPETEVTLELGRPEPAARPPVRRVVLRFESPEGPVMSSGSIQVWASGSPTGRTSIDRELTPEKGQVAFDAPVPGWVGCRPGSLVGCWFKETDFGIDPGEGAKVVTIPAVPAGAIAGQVLDAGGKPIASGVDVSAGRSRPRRGYRARSS
jgi:hypothetical protein